MNAAFTRFGSYALGQPIAEHPEAKGETLLDKLLATDKVPGEKRYRTQGHVEFLRGTWFVWLHVFEGRIFRLYATWSTKLQAPMVAMHLEVIDYCRVHLGGDMSGSKETGLTWKTDFGTVAVTTDINIHTYRGSAVTDQDYYVHIDSTAQPLSALTKL